MGNHYYGFEYRDGRHTTTDDHGSPISIAGAVHRFSSEEERDEWVEQGDSFCGGMNPFREAISTRTMLMGHSVYGPSAGYMDHTEDGVHLFIAQEL